ncbi:MAG: phosphatase PAP2 family protein [Umezawaea sp.]
MPTSTDSPRTTGERLRPPTAVAAICGALLTALVVATLAVHRAPLRVDEVVHGWVLTHRPSWSAHLAAAITVTGSGVPAYALAALAGALAVDARRWLGALLGLLALLSAQLPRLVLVSTIARPRPPHADWASSASGAALPSGHATTSMVVALLLTLAVHRSVHGGSRRWLFPVPVTWAVVVGLTRVHLGVHWATDVMAGWLLAWCWAGCAMIVVLLLRRWKPGVFTTTERHRT